jgi:hypothetical protein
MGILESNGVKKVLFHLAQGRLVPKGGRAKSVKSLFLDVLPPQDGLPRFLGAETHGIDAPAHPGALTHNQARQTAQKKQNKERERKIFFINYSHGQTISKGTIIGLKNSFLCFFRDKVSDFPFFSSHSGRIEYTSPHGNQRQRQKQVRRADPQA